jgi:hypothetical protein
VISIRPLERMELEMRSRGLSRKTIKAYLFNVEKILNFLRKPPQEATVLDIKRYAEQLIQNHGGFMVILPLVHCGFSIKRFWIWI